MLKGARREEEGGRLKDEVAEARKERPEWIFLMRRAVASAADLHNFQICSLRTAKTTWLDAMHTYVNV